MELMTLEGILRRAAGVEGSDGKYRVASGHRMTFYIGQPGQAMTVSEVDRVELVDGTVTLHHKEGAVLYVAGDAVHAVGVRPLKGGDDRRTGFM